MSYNYMDAGIASTILFVYPVMVAVIMGAFFKEKISAITIFSILLALSGIALLYQGDGGKPLSTVGIIFVLLSSLSYAIYIVGVNRSTLKNLPTTKLTFYAILFGLSVYIVRLNFCTELQTIPSAWLWADVLALAILPTAVSLVCTALAIHYIGSTPTAILGALEPVTALFFGVLLFHEKTHAPVNGRYFSDYHRRYLDYHWQVAHKKDEYAVADEQNNILLLINQSNSNFNYRKIW